jgi:hypothetical protein
MNVVYSGAQVVLTGGAILLMAVVAMLALTSVAEVAKPISPLLARAQTASALWVSATIRPAAGLLASTPSRAPPGAQGRRHELDIGEDPLLG